MDERISARILQAGIQHVELDLSTHYMFERDGFVALVARRDEEPGPIGAAGLLTEKGLAPLVWRSGQASFVAKGFEQSATPEQIEILRRFQADLEAALRP